MNRIADIAAHLGVSAMSVSRALAGKPGVGAELRRRIVRFAKSRGYRPNPRLSTLMAGLRSRKKREERETIAFITAFAEPLQWEAIPTIRRYHAGAEKRARALGYRIEHFWVNDERMPAQRLSKILYTRAITGAILAPLPVGRGTLDLDWPKFASVTFGQSLHRPPIHRVENDQARTMDVALAQIRRHGYRRIGFILGLNDDKRLNHAWRARYLLDQDLHAAARERIPILWVPELWYPDLSALLPRLDAWLREHEPDVILTVNNEVRAWLAALGRAIPRDIGFATCDLSSDLVGEVAGVDQNPENLGSAAVDIVVGQHHRNEPGIPPYPLKTVLFGKWSEGRTLPRRRREKAT